MTEPRTVWAIDVTTSVISLARIVESGEPAIPQIGLVQPVSFATHSPYSTWHHARNAAQRVIEKVTETGTPTSLILAKNFWGTTNKDTSADRRFRIYHALEDQLFPAGIPVSEFPYATASRWILGYTPRGRSPKYIHNLEVAAEELWGITPPTITTAAGTERRVPFRVSVTALAAIAAMGVGIEVAEVPVTEARLNIMSGDEPDRDRMNVAITWDKTRIPPKTISEWQQLHDHPEILKVTSECAAMLREAAS